MLHGMEYLLSFGSIYGVNVGRYSSPMEQHLQYTKTTSAEKVCCPLKTARSCYVPVGLGNLNPRLLGLDQPAGNGHPKLVVKCNGILYSKWAETFRLRIFVDKFPRLCWWFFWTWRRSTLQGKSPYPTIGKGKSSSRVPFWWDMLVPTRVKQLIWQNIDIEWFAVFQNTMWCRFSFH